MTPPDSSDDDSPSRFPPDVQAGIDAIIRRDFGDEYLQATRFLQANVARAQRAPIPAPPGFTLRDEANALVSIAFRNGFLEKLHDGSHAFDDGAMRKLMIESTAKLAELLFLSRSRPDLYAGLLAGERKRSCSHWEREAVHADLIKIVPTPCSACGALIRTGSATCGLCGAEQAPLPDIRP